MIREHTARRILAKIEESFKVRIKWADLGTGADRVGAETDCETGVIALNKSNSWTQDRLISYLLHEVAHILCFKRGIYKAFHKCYVPEELTDTELTEYIATAWKAECYVERLAHAMMRDMYPGRTFWYVYGRRKMAKEWFDLVDVLPYKEELRKRKLRSIDRKMREKK